MSAPTPRPWRRVGATVQAGEYRQKSHVLVADCSDLNLTREENEANAALIVRAVNAHEALVEALGAMPCVVCETPVALPPRSLGIPGIEGCPGCKQARAALAAAKEGA